MPSLLKRASNIAHSSADQPKDSISDVLSSSTHSTCLSIKKCRAGSIVGIVLSVIALIAIIGFILLFYKKHQKSKKQLQDIEQARQEADAATVKSYSPEEQFDLPPPPPVYSTINYDKKIKDEDLSSLPIYSESSSLKALNNNKSLN